jgi:hypothetical protein
VGLVVKVTRKVTQGNEVTKVTRKGTFARLPKGSFLVALTARARRYGTEVLSSVAVTGATGAVQAVGLNLER